MRRSGPHHCEALELAVFRVTGRAATALGVPLAGSLDNDILMNMLTAAGIEPSHARAILPAVVEKAQMIYSRICPDLRSCVCPGVRGLLPCLLRSGATTGLVTGNLRRIGWKKLERAGLRHFFRYGAFSGMAESRGALAKLARQHAIRQGLIRESDPAFLIGDHPNDIAAARGGGLTAIAVATGVVPSSELARHQPDLLLKDLRELRLETLV